MSARDPRLARARRWYALVLRLYPAAHRRNFEAEMRQTFADHYRDVAAQDGRVGPAFWLAVLTDEARSIVRERRAASGRGRRIMRVFRGRGGVVALLLAALAVAAMAPLRVLLVAPLLLAATGVALVWALRRWRGAARWRVGLVVGLLAIPMFLVARAQVASATTNTRCAVASTPALASPASPVTAADYLAQGDDAFDRGDCAYAIAAYSQAIALDPQYAEAYNNRAYAYMMEEDYARALPDLDRAIQLRPTYIHALMNRGDIYNYDYAIDRQKAVADYDRIIAQGPAAYRDTSVCGHRYLALHDGWHLSTLAVFVQGPDAGCH
jgi:tetratricopeptide (TPR) repeat protein